MPYPGVPDRLTEKMEKCVKKVMADGKGKSAAIAICKESIMEDDKRDLTLTERSDIIQRVWNTMWDDSDPDFRIPWARMIFEDYIVFQMDGVYYRVPYAWDTTNVEDLTFDVEGIVQAEHSFAPVRSVLQRRPIRAVGDNRYETYAVLFGSPDKRDLLGTYFDKGTNYYLDWYNERPWLYNHGTRPQQLVQTRSQRIGMWDEIGMDDQGVFVRGELDVSHRYWEAVKQLVDDGILHPSSGTVDYMMRVAPDGHVDDWPVVEVSSTPQPGEWRTSPISAASQRAVEMLSEGVSTQGRHTMSLTDKLKEVLSPRRDADVEADEVEEETEEEEVEPEETTDDSDVEDESEDEDLELVEQIRSLQEDVKTLVDHINTGFRSIDTRLGEHEEAILRVAQDKVESVRSATSDPHWSENLFVPTRSSGLPQGAEEMSEEESAATREANQGDDKPSDVFNATRVV